MLGDKLFHMDAASNPGDRSSYLHTDFNSSILYRDLNGDSIPIDYVPELKYTC
jgi:hypothetical protein